MPDINQARRYRGAGTPRLRLLNAAMVEPLYRHLEVNFVACPKGMKRARIAAEAQRLLMNYALGH